MNMQDVEKILKDAEVSVEDFGFGEFEVEALGTFKQVRIKGGEGEGERWYSVKYFPKHDIYIKTIGYYQSYSGVEFYEGYGKIVKPKKKTITVYE